VQVKVCGITRSEDASAASLLGVDAIGLVFWAQSKRAVTIDKARPICEAISPFTTITALFVSATEAEVESVLASLPINLLQFHGDETPAFCEQWSVPYIRALRAEPGVDSFQRLVVIPVPEPFLSMRFTTDSLVVPERNLTGVRYRRRLIGRSFWREALIPLM